MIDVVFDVYPETSIKIAERCNRGSSAAIQCLRPQYPAVDEVPAQLLHQVQSDQIRTRIMETAEVQGEAT